MNQSFKKSLPLLEKDFLFKHLGGNPRHFADRSDLNGLDESDLIGSDGGDL